MASVRQQGSGRADTGRGRGTDGGSVAGDGGELTFPDVPRLELDTLLAQLIDRAQEVISTQGRLRGLLKATRMITADLALPVVLHQIAAAARDLVGARYAALGVIAADGHLSEFVHVGMPEGLVELIGQLPQGKGLLGALIDDPAPIRLDRLGEDERSSGFPAGHPPMDSFLGVPVRVRDEVFGNLYLAESTRGAFSAEDEELATALAASAGVVIANARLYEAAQDRHKWLQASAMITRRLLSPDPDGTGRPLQLIAERCGDIAGADLVTVVLPAEEAVAGPRDLRVEIAVGQGSEVGPLVGRTVSVEASLAGRVFSSGEPLRVGNAQEETGVLPIGADTLDIGPVLVVPLKGSQRMHGVLTAARLRGSAAFTAEDLDMATGFASQASMAIELAEARAEQQRAAMFEERDRIAADLHDHVIQRLFATGLSLQSTIAGLPPGRGKDRILTAVTDLDDTIKQIRTSIFQLHRPSPTSGSEVRARLLEVIAALTPVLEFEPSIRFEGVLENVLDEAAVEDLLAVLREALSNIARHAGARTVVVSVACTGGRLTLEVIDDGAGLRPTNRRSGLANLSNRAESHGGAMTLTANEPSGTRLIWSIPVR